MRVADYSPGSIDAQRADEGAGRRRALEQSARDSLALGRNVGAALKRGDFAGAVADTIDSTVAAVSTLPPPEQSPALLGALEAHRPIVQTELVDPTKAEYEVDPLPQRLADPVSIYDDAGAAPEGQEIAPGAWSAYQDIDDSGAAPAGAELAPGAWSAYQTLKAEDDTATRAKGVLSRMGDPEAQAAHAQQVEGARLHLAGQERPELVERARRAMGLAVPSARPGKNRGNYPEAAADPAESNYGSGMEGMVGKGMVAYSGNTKATPQNIADDFTVSAFYGKPEDTLNTFQLKPEADAQAGQVNARLMEAAKKSPVVALGADPRNTVYTKEAARDAVGGAYGRTLGGKIQANVNSPATAAHESIHNGLDRLLKDPKLPARFKKQLGNHEQQEFITRMFMIKTYGETESEGEQALGFKGNHPQIIRAREMLADPKWQAWAADLEAYAARKIARDRPGGPR